MVSKIEIIWDVENKVLTLLISNIVDSVPETCEQHSRFDEITAKLYQIEMAILIPGIDISNRILLQAF